MARSERGSQRHGYTLIELLVATTLTLVMMGGVATVFGMIGQGIAAARAGLEMTDALRSVANRLRADLDGIQAPRSFEGLVPSQPGRPQQDGYFEYTEGPIGPVVAPNPIAKNNDQGGDDTTVGDMDDMLLFTTRNTKSWFAGRHYGTVIESPDAEVAWFVRGRTLYRRQLLVAPSVAPLGNPSEFYADSDVSVRNEGGTLRANTLSDLAKPENRFAHQTLHRYPAVPPNPAFWALGRPYHPHFSVDWTTGTFYPTPWSSVASGVLSPSGRARQGLGLPTLGECSSQPSTQPPPAANQTLPWIAGGPLRIDAAALPNVAPLPLLTSAIEYDAWLDPHPWNETSLRTGTLRTYSNPDDPNYMAKRLGEDVILNNVLSFDVKAWDPGAPVLLVNANALVTPDDNLYGAQLGQYVAWRAANPNSSPPAAVPQPVFYGAYVDLNYMCLIGGPATGDPAYTDHLNPAIQAPQPLFYGAGHVLSFLRGTEPYAKNWSNLNDWPAPPLRRPSVYDTWSNHYEVAGLGFNGLDDDRDGVVDNPSEWPSGLPLNARFNGIDDNGNGWIDENDPTEWLPAPAPYAGALRGIQIKIRVFEPDSRQIREVTIVHSFVK